MRIAIVGSRDYLNLDAVWRFVDSLPTNSVVISGGARGVDRVAAKAARRRGLVVVEYLADWNRYGRGAGMRRNYEIVRDCNVLATFWDGFSRGTSHAIDVARQQGKRVLHSPEKREG